VDAVPAAPACWASLPLGKLAQGDLMTGFKNFILRGNLVDLAGGVIIGLAFAKVVATFTQWLTALLPESTSNVFEDTKNSFGAFLNAAIAFLIMAAVVYFFVVVPYTKAKEKYFPSEAEGTPADIALLAEIRDLLAARNQA
jgi:large conductance mechanosensitive channel